MNSELYTAASGLLVEERRVELIANNLANLSTTGFRAQRSFSTVYRGLEQADARARLGNRAVALAGTYEVPGPGPKRATGRALDVFLGSGNLLVVEAPGGRRYTRDGSLSVSDAGELVERSGHPLIGAGGKRIGGLSAAARVTADGRVLDGQQERGRLMVVRDEANVLVPEGNNLLTAAGNDDALETVTRPTLDPGWLEGSGVDPLGEMVRLIEAQRAFESYQRLISVSMNEVNRRTVNDIAG